MRLAIITTHPIQYYAPVFELLAQKIDLMVFYTWGQASLSKHDPGFGKIISWDINLLNNYPYQWVKNIAADPGSHHFNGIDNPDLIDQLNYWKPDAVLVYGWAYKSHLRVIRYFKGKLPVLFRGDSTLLDEKPGIKNLLRQIYLRWVYSNVDYALYTGTNNKAYFQKYGFKEKQLLFAPHAVDNDRFAIPRQAEVSALKQQLGVNDDDILVLFAGKLEEKKDPGLLLKSFIDLNTPNVHLLFASDGSLRNQLQKQADGCHDIHFISFQNQSYMPVVYQACDIFCLPSKGPGETWGLAVNEAMACGKAILVSDKVGCAADLIEPGANGYIHKAGSVTELTEKLRLLIAGGKDGLVQMGKKSKQLIGEWTIAAQADKIVTYLNERK